MPSNYIDISPLLTPDLQGWPGDTPFNISNTWTIGPECPVNVSRITLSSHYGAHADAPLHYRADGRSIDMLPIDTFIGLCHVVHVHHGSGLIAPEEVLPALPASLSRVLISQYAKPQRSWDSAMRGLSSALIDALAARGVKLIGVDAASVDPETSKSLDAHHAIDRHGMVIIEGLVLSHVEPGAYSLIALPLNIAGCDGAPLRAVLKPLKER